MSTLPHIEQAVQNILTTRAKELERETGFVQRSTAQLDGPAFAQTVVFGWMSLPEARRRGERPGRPQGSPLPWTNGPGMRIRRIGATLVVACSRLKDSILRDFFTYGVLLSR